VWPTRLIKPWHSWSTTARTFYTGIGLGDNPKGTSSIDTGGVALAAIKRLNQVLQEKETRISAQEEEIQTLKAENRDLSERLSMLENLVKKLNEKEGAMHP